MKVLCVILAIAVSCLVRPAAAQVATERGVATVSGVGMPAARAGIRRGSPVSGGGG